MKHIVFKTLTAIDVFALCFMVESFEGVIELFGYRSFMFLDSLPFII
jgi:hypothetical protein